MTKYARNNTFLPQTQSDRTSNMYHYNKVELLRYMHVFIYLEVLIFKATSAIIISGTLF